MVGFVRYFISISVSFFQSLWSMSAGEFVPCRLSSLSLFYCHVVTFCVSIAPACVHMGNDCFGLIILYVFLSLDSQPSCDDHQLTDA